MKKWFIGLSLGLLLMTACGNSGITVATQEEIDAYPEQEPVMLAWQAIVEAGENKDCQILLDYMRKSLKVEGSECPDIYTYFEEGAPVIDWSRTQWSSEGGKAKIYEKDHGSITSFIHNEADDTWKVDQKFW